MEIRQRQQSAMTYQEYLFHFNREPDSPRLFPKQSPVEPLSDLELTPIQENNKRPIITQSLKLINVTSKLL